MGRGLSQKGLLLKLLILTKYTATGPSSRYRFLQYLAPLTRQGHVVTVRPLFTEVYLKRRFSQRAPNPLYLLWRFVLRFLHCLDGRRFDAVWIEGELWPFVPGWVERAVCLLLPPRRFHDFDDAIWLRYAAKPLRQKFRPLLSSATGLTVGNANLAGELKPIQPRICQVPTSLSWEKYQHASPRLQGSRLVWIGSPSTLFFLEDLLPVLRKLRERHAFTLRIIGAQPSWKELDLECMAWSEAEEVHLLEACQVGIMPLRDDAWSRGKCGLKLLQYLATGLPAVASPVGVNRAILDASGGGLAAENAEQWIEALGRLLSSEILRKTCGERGREWVRRHMTVEAQAPRLLRFLEDGIESRGRP